MKRAFIFTWAPLPIVALAVFATFSGGPCGGPSPRTFASALIVLLVLIGGMIAQVLGIVMYFRTFRTATVLSRVLAVPSMVFGLAFAAFSALLSVIYFEAATYLLH